MNFQMGIVKQFQINGETYVIHGFVLNKASIFKSLNEADPKGSNIIILNATSDDLAKIIAVLYGNRVNEIFTKSSAENIIHIYSIMMCMGINVNIIKEVITQMLDNDEDVVKELVTLESLDGTMKILMGI